VEDYLRGELKNEDWDKFLRTYPEPKIVSLLESIEEARKSNEEALFEAKKEAIGTENTYLWNPKP
jgi:hypothetical protein